ncbi:hypothetical protein NDA16_000908 [Ustilago loliicola]|nr:hypothetical protein NDA16_000908 [Ustilago loliicola]
MAEAKLTKKQQKNAAFRAKKGKTAALADHPATPDDVVDPEDAASTSKAEPVKASSSFKKASKSEKAPKSKETSKSEAVLADEPAAEAPVKEEKRSHKRKRLAAEAAAGITSEAEPSSSTQSLEKKAKSAPKPKKAVPEAPAKKTTFGDDGEVSAEQAVKPEIPTTITESSAKGNKFILFVGNMAFTTTADYISKHFGQTCGEVPSVRLLTRKADPNALANLPASKRKSIAKGKAQDPTKPQSKGYAFVEFKTSEALRKALKFHHTMLEGRKINVELTAGGGGKSETRQEKIKAKNAGLEKERQKLHGKYVAPKNEARRQARGEKGGEEGEGRERKRQRRDGDGGDGQDGGSGGWGRNSGKERKMPRFMATGSNAVRVAPTS